MVPPTTLYRASHFVKPLPFMATPANIHISNNPSTTPDLPIPSTQDERPPKRKEPVPADDLPPVDTPSDHYGSPIAPTPANKPFDADQVTREIQQQVTQALLDQKVIRGQQTRALAETAESARLHHEVEMTK